MPDFRDQVRAVICTAGAPEGYQKSQKNQKRWSQVKHSSVDNSMPRWRDGQLHIAEDNRGKFVLVVEVKNGPSKMFTIHKNIKSKTVSQSNPGRCVIAIRDGSLVHLNQAYPPHLQALSEMLDFINNNGVPQNYTGHKSPPISIKRTASPYKAATVSRSPSVGKRTSPPESTLFTTVRSKTPLSSRKQMSTKRKTPDDECAIDIDDDVDGENLGASMLFTDQTDKENIYTPNISRHERQSVLHMREKGGGSIFLQSFDEKQRDRENDSANKRKGPNPAKSVSVNFYNRSKQMANFGASDFLSSSTPRSQPPPQSEDSAKKRTPGFLSVTGNNSNVKKFNSSWRPWKSSLSVDSQGSNLQGFSNLGNTCYMNAILQSLLGLQCFVQDLQKIELIRAMPKANLYRALAALLYAKQSQKGSLEVGLKLQKVKEAISATATRFSGFMQHDAHEFLCQCLDQLKEDVGKVNNPKKDNQNLPQKLTNESNSSPSQVVPSDQLGDQLPADGAADETSNDRSAEKLAKGCDANDQPPTAADKLAHLCAISQNFELEVVHSILCQGCGEEVTKRETFNDLSLDLPRTREAFSLQTALDSFFASEKLEYACAKCDCKEASVSHKFTKLPRVLVLHLKRYMYNSEAAMNGKLRVGVGIPRYLTLAWHTTEDTKPPPPRTSCVNIQAMPLSPIRNNMRTPSSKLASPKQIGSSGGFRKQLYSDSGSREKFQFKRARSLSSSPRDSKRFISRYDDFTPVQTTTKDKELEEMDEDAQLAFVLEMSRKEAEASKIQVYQDDEPTDEELIQAMDTSATNNRTQNHPKESNHPLRERHRDVQGALHLSEDSDDELPPGLADGAEDEDLKRALEASKRTLEDEMMRRGGRLVNEDVRKSSVAFASLKDISAAEADLGGIPIRGHLHGLVNDMSNHPVPEIGLLGGTREDTFSMRSIKRQRAAFMEMSRSRDSSCKDSAQVTEDSSVRDDSEVTFVNRSPSRLLGGVKKPNGNGQPSGTEEPMETDSDQPLAFSLGNDSEEDDHAKPKMWDVEYEMKRPLSTTKSVSAKRPNKLLKTFMQETLCDKSSKDNLVVGGVEGLQDMKDTHQCVENNVGGDTVQSSMHQKKVDDGVNGTQSPSSPQSDNPCLRRSKEKSSSFSDDKTPSHVLPDCGIDSDQEGASLWRKNKNCKKNILKEFSIPRTVVLSSTDDDADVLELKPDDGKDDDDFKKANAEEGAEEASKQKSGGGGDASNELEELLTYEEIRQKEEEDIRRATELSMKEAKEIEEKEAAELLKAQEMSLQELNESCGVIPLNEEEEEKEESGGTSPIYSQEMAEMLSKNSEEGHLNHAYRLVSIVSHIGSTSMTGHYVSDVYDPAKRTWLSYDDSAVMKRDERALREERQRSGYIFFYQAKEFL